MIDVCVMEPILHSAVGAESPPFIPLVKHEITEHVQPKLLLCFCFHRCFNEATCRRHNNTKQTIGVFLHLLEN